MIAHISIEELRKYFNSKISERNWSYASLSRIKTEYKSESGLKKALKEGTIKYDSLMTLIREKGLIDDLTNHFKKTKRNEELHRACLIVASNMDEAMKIPILRNTVGIHALKLLRMSNENGKATLEELLDNI